MLKETKIGFIQDFQFFLNEGLTFEKLIRNKYSKKGKAIYYCVFAFLIIMTTILFYSFTASLPFKYIFPLLYLVSITILIFRSNKMFKVFNRDVLLMYSNRTREYELKYENFSDNYKELRFILAANYFQQNNLSLQHLRLIQEDDLENNQIEEYKWFSKPIILSLLTYITGCIAAYYLKNDLFIQNEGIFFSIMKLSSCILITLPFSEYNLFKMRHDSKKIKIKENRRFLAELKLRLFETH